MPRKKKEKSTQTGLHINLRDLDVSAYADEFRYLVRKIGEKSRGWVKGNPKGSDVVNLINNLIDKAHAGAKSRGKRVDRNSDFITTKNGLRQFQVKDINIFLKKDRYEQYAILNSMLDLVNNPIFSKKGIQQHLSDTSNKSVSTIKTMILNNSTYKEAVKLGIEIDVDGLAEDVFKTMCQKSTNKEDYDSEQLVQEAVEEFVKQIDLDKIIREKIEEQMNTKKIDNDDFNERFNKYARGGNAR